LLGVKVKIRSKPPLELRNIRQRLAGVLLHPAVADTARKPGLSQSEMAMMLGTTREMVNRALVSIEMTGAIRIERHRIIISKAALERIAGVASARARAYVLLRTRNDDLEQATALIRRQPGVVMADQIEGRTDVIFAVQATDRETLAKLMLRAIASVEEMTEEIQLLPAKE
jgi:DNA-binding Lrp family transcriptional regulator